MNLKCMNNSDDISKCFPCEIESFFIDENRHEAIVVCMGKHRITLNAFEKMQISEKTVISYEEFEQLQYEETWLSCIQKALSYLEYGDLSKRRLIEKLRRNFDKSFSTSVADYLEQRGYINDTELAHKYADNYLTLRQYGLMRIRKELYQKGFSIRTIDNVLADYADFDFSDSIRQLLYSKFSQNDLNDPKIRAKAYSFLQQKGYSWSEISQVITDN